MSVVPSSLFLDQAPIPLSLSLLLVLSPLLHSLFLLLHSFELRVSSFLSFCFLDSYYLFLLLSLFCFLVFSLLSLGRFCSSLVRTRMRLACSLARALGRDCKIFDDICFCFQLLFLLFVCFLCFFSPFRYLIFFFFIFSFPLCVCFCRKRRRRCHDNKSA